MKKIVLLLAACMLAAGEMNTQKLSGREIIQKVKDRPDGNTRYAEMELTLRKKNGTTRQRKVNSWALESVPVDKHEIYSRKVSWIRQDCLTAAYVEYYDKLNKLHRVLTVSDVKKVQGFWTIHKMEMKNVQTEHSTLIVVKNPQYNIKIDKALFTVAKLEKGL